MTKARNHREWDKDWRAARDELNAVEARLLSLVGEDT